MVFQLTCLVSKEDNQRLEPKPLEFDAPQAILLFFKVHEYIYAKTDQ